MNNNLPSGFDPDKLEQWEWWKNNINDDVTIFIKKRNFFLVESNEHLSHFKKTYELYIKPLISFLKGFLFGSIIRTIITVVIAILIPTVAVLAQDNAIKNIKKHCIEIKKMCQRKLKPIVNNKG